MRNPRAKILGAGLTVTLEHPGDGARVRAHVLSRHGATLRVESLPGGTLGTVCRNGGPVRIRVARPFGLFCYEADPVDLDGGGAGTLRIRPGPARRRQLREFFRLPVRLGVRLEPDDSGATPSVVSGVDLSAGGILIQDPDGRLAPGDRVRLGLPIGPNRCLLRLSARVVRIQAEKKGVALEFEEIGEAARQSLLRFLFHEHRRRERRRRRGGRGARVTALPPATNA